MKLLTALLAALLLVASCQRSEEASSSDSSTLTRVYPLKHLQPGETLRALQSLDLDQSVTVRADNKANSIVATFTSPQHGDAIADLLAQIDVAHVNPPTRFVNLKFVDAEAAVNEVSRRLQAPDSGFNILPDTRTNRVFLMGTVEQIDKATAMLRKIDIQQAP